MNVFFMIDIIVNFFSAFYEADLKIIDDYKVKTYCLIPYLAYRSQILQRVVHYRCNDCVAL